MCDYMVVLLCQSYLNPRKDLDMVCPGLINREDVLDFLDRLNENAPHLLDDYRIVGIVNGAPAATWTGAKFHEYFHPKHEE